MGSYFNQIRPLTTELPTFERLKNLYNVVNTGCSSFLHVTRTTIKSRMSKKFDQIQAWTAELAAIDRLKKYFTYLRTIQNILMTRWLSGERSLLFGLIVSKFEIMT